MAEFEFAGMTFRGGKMMVVLTALSTLGGGAWAGFEFYNDYRNMKEVVENIDVDAIKAENELVITKLDEAIDYTRDIKSGLRDDILSIETQADRVEDDVREMEDKVRNLIDSANERFENKRNQLQSDYDERLTRLNESNARDMKDLEDRLNDRIQRVIDNPLADG